MQVWSILAETHLLDRKHLKALRALRSAAQAKIFHVTPAEASLDSNSDNFYILAELLRAAISSIKKGRVPALQDALGPSLREAVSAL